MTTFYNYAIRQAERLKAMGRTRTGEIYAITAKRFIEFRRNPEVTFSEIDTPFIDAYEAYLINRGVCRNTSSFYLRALRRIYNMAVADGFTSQRQPFSHVYTGVDRTPKRAVTQGDISSIYRAHLPPGSPVDYARDMFMLSFCLRGMSFVDMAYLRKRDLRNGYITYCRRKTGQQLIIRWEDIMQKILRKYPPNRTQYLLPIIQYEDGTERQQYLSRLLYVNRKLKKLARIVGLPPSLSMYVARHSWASIAHQRDVPLAVICQAMGHESEQTTQIYLSQILSNRIDEANYNILQDL